MGFVGRVRETLSDIHSARCRILHREGWTRCARPTGSPLTAFVVCPTGCRPLSHPRSRVLIPPAGVLHAKKSPHFHASSSLNMAVREGWTRFARPSGSPFTAFMVCPTGCRPLSNPRSRILIPPGGVLHAKKKPAFSCELFFKYGGEGGIRTLDTLPYTHFPGVLLQPLGHLTILLSRCCWDGR